MGYTHYWDHDQISPGIWENLLFDTRFIVESADIPVAGPFGIGPVEINRERIALNGANGDDYETFSITPNATGFDFCKTGQRPYDLVVTTILLRATLTIPGFNVRSDGDWSEWQDTRDLYKALFGPPPEDSPFK